jgi:4-hydroxy-3-methylbut-2-enyl diphosphate reductase
MLMATTGEVETMRVILADPRGFCAGVNMAIDSLDHALRIFGPPVYVYHEIVHNKPVVDDFIERGAIFVDELDEVPEGSNLLFSAHGVSPEVRAVAQSRSLRVIDATCPLVTKVHTEAKHFARRGRTILFVGHQGHDEVVGTMGEAPDRMLLVETEEDAASIDIADPSSLAYLTQTTLSVDDADRIAGRLRERFPEIVAPATDDICYATQNRQDAVRRLALDADVVLVLGSRNSSNSQRLAEIAHDLGKAAYLFDGVEEMDSAWFAGARTVLVTAGASAPERVVQDVVRYLEEEFGATVETRSTTTEDMEFQLPAELRRIMKSEKTGV